MIHQINSDFPGFKPINLTSGVNIILAEKKENTTNSLGKSLLLETINFIFGADYSKSTLSKHKDLQGYSILATIDFGKEKNEYKRQISPDDSKYIFDSSSVIPWTIEEWRLKLLKEVFKYNNGNSIVTWRNLFHYFFQNNTSLKFEDALKSYKGDPEYKTSLLQSFLLNLATNEIERHSQTKQISSEKKNFNRYLNTLKKSLDIIPDLVPNINDIALSNKKIIEQVGKLKTEITKLERKRNLINIKNNALLLSLEELKTKTHDTSIEGFESFFRIIEVELGDYIKKTFEEAKIFHDSLISENITVIRKELAQNHLKINSIQSNINKKYQELDRLFKNHNLNNEKFEHYKYEDFILNTLVNDGGQLITSIVDENIKVVAKEKNLEIPNLLSKEFDRIDNYRRFLTTFVNLVYKYDKNIEFNISYENKLKVTFKYNDDTGTGKGNMKIIIYYIFILLLNKVYLKRNIDFLILDTDITDGIDSNNLFDLLKITDRLFKKHDLQLILTLRNDRNINWDYIENKKWIKYRLSDKGDGYLFKKDLK